MPVTMMITQAARRVINHFEARACVDIRVTIDGVQHVIVKIDRKPQAGTVVAWLVYVRK